MPSRPLPFGSDTLVVPAHFAHGSGADDPSLLAWKNEHPDWFEAGTWTLVTRPRAKTGVMSRMARPVSPEWMRQTREIERQQIERGRPATEAEWIADALHSATMPLTDPTFGTTPSHPLTDSPVLEASTVEMKGANGHQTFVVLPDGRLPIDTDEKPR